MPKCAFLSIANTEGWFIDDDLVHPFLHDLSWSVSNIPWNQPTDWNEFDLVVIRSPWDYQQHLEEFKQVLQEIRESNAALLNPLDLVIWNIHKSYLFELESKGVELVPTLRFPGLSGEKLEEAFLHFSADQLIVKPLIGANADYTYRLKKSQPESWKTALEAFQFREGMIQPFMESIVSEGEFSLMYFQGKLSHTILKTAGEGDFRIQEEHGGGVIPISEADPKLIAAAEMAMNCLPQKPFYARVDLIRTPGDSFALMELELIEPCLYFRFDQDSPRLFANLLDEFWRANSGQA